MINEQKLTEPKLGLQYGVCSDYDGIYFAELRNQTTAIHNGAITAVSDSFERLRCGEVWPPWRYNEWVIVDVVFDAG